MKLIRRYLKTPILLGAFSLLAGVCSADQAARDACRAAGFTDADERSYVGHMVHIDNVGETFRFYGADEGHDHAGSLERELGFYEPSVCNLTQCSMIDTGCQIPFTDIDWDHPPVKCLGNNGSNPYVPLDFVCRHGESCLGEWHAAGGPLTTSSTWWPSESQNGNVAFHSPWMREDELSGSLAVSFTPWNCDCVEADSGWQAFLEVWATSDGIVPELTRFRSIRQDLPPGSLMPEGPGNATIQLKKAYVCAVSWASSPEGATVPISTTTVSLDNLVWDPNSPLVRRFAARRLGAPKLGESGAAGSCGYSNWYAADKQADCENDSPSGCVRKQMCGAEPCAWPGYCWAPSGRLSVEGGFGPTNQCSDHGMFPGDQYSACEDSCGGAACVRKQVCGDLPCEAPGYCWKCGVQ